jgi:hypothetical protein
MSYFAIIHRILSHKLQPEEDMIEPRALHETYIPRVLTAECCRRMSPRTLLKTNPETNLTVLCARTFLSTLEPSSLQSAFAGPLNWSLLEQNAENHGVMPVVAHVLTQYGNGLIPHDILKTLRDRLLRSAQNNLAWSQEWLRILRIFAESCIPAISFKGPALALTAYGNLALREFTDIDLLVRPSDVVRAREILIHNEYILDSVVPDNLSSALTRLSDRQISFVKHDDRVAKLDLHWGVAPKGYSFPLEVDSLFETAFVARHQKISFLCLSPEHLLLLLCAHGIKHCWSNLRLLCDLARHVQSNPGLDWDRCIRLVESGNYDLAMKHSLLLARQVLKLELPEPIGQYADSDAKARAVADKAQTFLFRENIDRSPSSDDRGRYLEVLRYHLALEKRQRFRRAAAMVLRHMFIPNEADWGNLRLPRGLFFLYYLFRPLRLVVKQFSLMRFRLNGQ